jgi:hypothetical protein
MWELGGASVPIMLSDRGWPQLMREIRRSARRPERYSMIHATRRSG